MTNEEAARLLDPETNLAAMEELQYYHGFAWQEILVKALREARKMGADALRNTGCFRGEPLTLEQLREVPHGKIKDNTLQSICNRANEIACYSVHIDRETWEPCELCEKQRKVFNEKFCGECGRPLTEEAWAELEKRISRKEEQ